MLVLDRAQRDKHIPIDSANPARFKDLAPKHQKLERRHHAAMNYAEVPAFVARLREQETIPGLALELLILTAVRAGEVLGTRWPEIDLDARLRG